MVAEGVGFEPLVLFAVVLAPVKSGLEASPGAEGAALIDV